MHVGRWALLFLLNLRGFILSIAERVVDFLARDPREAHAAKVEQQQPCPHHEQSRGPSRGQIDRKHSRTCR